MEKLIEKLQQRRGDISIESALVCLIGFMFLAVCLEIGRTYITINAIKSKADSAVLTVAAANVANVYDGVRESAGTARSVSDGEWEELVSTDEVKNSLIEILSLSQSGEDLERISTENKMVYRLSDVSTEYVNADGDNLNFKTRLTVTIPLGFLGLKINQRLEVNTTYDAKF